MLLVYIRNLHRKEMETVLHLLCHCEVVWKVWSKWLGIWQIEWAIPWSNFGECLFTVSCGQYGCVEMRLGFWSKGKWPDKWIPISDFVRNPVCFS
ncbi:hypothetical protein GQ457_06G012850 [Hibiscus cannabinus]